MAAQSRNRNQQQGGGNPAWLFGLAGIAVTGWLIWSKWAFTPILWLLTLAACIVWPKPQNPNDPQGEGVAAYNFAKTARRMIGLPGAQWGIGVGEQGADRWWIAGRNTRIRLTTCWAIGVAAWMAMWPVKSITMRPANALFAYLMIQSITAARRRTALEDGEKVPAVAANRGEAPSQGGMNGIILVGLWSLLGAAVAYGVFTLTGIPQHHYGDDSWAHWSFLDRIWMAVGFVPLIGFAFWSRRYKKWALQAFYDKRALVAEWTKRWQDIGRVPATLSREDSFPPDDPMIKVARFAAAEGDEPMSFVKEEGSLESSLSSPLVAIYGLPQRSTTGSNIAGTRHQMGFNVAWALGPLGDRPHLNSDLPQPVFEFAVRAAVGRAFTAAKLDRGEVIDVKALHRDPNSAPPAASAARPRPEGDRPRPGPPVATGTRPDGPPTAVAPPSAAGPAERQRPTPPPRPAGPAPGGVQRPTRRGGGLWMVKIRLYGSTTLQKLSDKVDQIKTALGAEWVQVAATAPSGQGIGELPADQVVLVYGSDPGYVELANRRHDLWLESLKWNHVFVSAKVTGEHGRAPQLLSVGKVETNKAIDRLTFELPGGLSYEQCRAAYAKIADGSHSVFLEFRRVKGSATQFEVLSCLTDPLPELVPYQFEPPKESWRDPKGDMLRIPIGKAPDGTVVNVFFPDTPHFGVWGGTGSGKSFSLMTYVYGALVRGWEVVLCDSVKEAADFKIFQPWCQSTATTIESVSSTIETVYQEVIARKKVNAAHGAANWMELPPEVRPKPLLFVIDEAFSTVQQASVPRSGPSDIVEEAKQVNAWKGLILDRMGRIAREARSAGVYMIIAAQRGDAQVLKGEFKANLLGRLGLGSMAKNERELAFKSPEEAPPLERGYKGRGVIEQEGAPTTIVQTFFATQPEFERHLLEFLGEGVDPDEVVNQLPVLSTSAANRAAGSRMLPPPVPSTLVSGPGAPSRPALPVFDPKAPLNQPSEHVAVPIPLAAPKPIPELPAVGEDDIDFTIDDDGGDDDVGVSAGGAPTTGDLVFDPNDW